MAESNIRPFDKNRAQMAKAFRELADQAESGELQGMAMVVFTNTDEEPDFYVGGNFSFLTMTGALHELMLTLRETE